MTPAQHKAQRDMVARSLLVSLTRSERSEERPRRRVEKSPAAPVVRDAPSHRFAFPVVTERPL